MDRHTAADLLDNLVGMVDDTNGNNYDDALKMGIEALKADAVNVVRCKDCKHNSLKRVSGNAFCDLGIGLNQIYDFCSFGERKDGNI